MKVCITSLYDEKYKDISSISLKSFEIFCEYNNSDLKIYSKLIDNFIHPAWNKLLAIKECLNTYDIVLWADIDSIFIPRKENFIKYNNFDESCNFMTSFDGNGLCSSHILMNRCDYNIKLIDTLLFLKDVKNDDIFGLGHGPKWEQNAMKGLIQHFNIKYQFMNDFTVTDYISSVLPNKNTFFYHFSAYEINQRYDLMKNCIKNIFKY
jgi:hypothetical protein